MAETVAVGRIETKTATAIQSVRQFELQSKKALESVRREVSKLDSKFAQLATRMGPVTQSQIRYQNAMNRGTKATTQQIYAQAELAKANTNLAKQQYFGTRAQAELTRAQNVSTLAANRSSRAMKNNNSVLERTTKSLRDMHSKLIGIYAAWHSLRGVVNFFKGALTQSVALQEATQRLNVILGEEAASIHRLSDTSARLFGQTKTSLIETAGEVAHFFSNFGVGRKEAAAYSKTLIELARDFASFNNLAGGAQQALEAMRSGLIGLPRPARRLGVFISQLRVENKALELGMKRVNGQFSDAQKFMARYHIILEDSAFATGDFARTQHMLANSSRILKAQLQDIWRSIGDALNPTVTDAVNDLIAFIETDKQAALWDFDKRFGEIMQSVRSMGGAASGTEGRVFALFETWREKGRDAVHTTDRLVAELYEMGVKLDDLNIRQKKWLADGMLPGLAAVGDRINDLENRSFWEDVGEFFTTGIVGDIVGIATGPVGFLSKELFRHFEDLEEPTKNWRKEIEGVDRMMEGMPGGVIKWLDALDKVPHYILPINALLQRTGQEEINLSKLRVDLRKVDRRTYDDYFSFRMLKEAELRDDLLATGRFTIEQAERTAHIVIEYAIEENNARKELVRTMIDENNLRGKFAQDQILNNASVNAGLDALRRNQTLVLVEGKDLMLDLGGETVKVGEGMTYVTSHGLFNLHSGIKAFYSTIESEAPSAQNAMKLFYDVLNNKENTLADAVKAVNDELGYIPANAVKASTWILAIGEAARISQASAAGAPTAIITQMTSDATQRIRDSANQLSQDVQNSAASLIRLAGFNPEDFGFKSGGTQNPPTFASLEGASRFQYGS